MMPIVENARLSGKRVTEYTLYLPQQKYLRTLLDSNF